MDIYTLIALTLVGGVSVSAIIFVKSRIPKKEVLHLRPRDKRGEKLKISEETDLAAICKRKNNSVNRYIKKGCAWVFNESGRMVTKFFGTEVNAYTARPKGDYFEKVPISDFLKALWGETFYAQIPEDQRRAIETDIVGITLEIEPIDPEAENLPNLTSDQINDEDDSLMLKKFVDQSKGSTTKRDITTIGGAMLLAALFMFFLMTRFWGYHL